MEKQYDHNGDEWETIEPTPRQTHINEPLYWESHTVLLNYVYSTKLDAFIHMQTFDVINAKHFNETYEHLPMPKRHSPEDYVRTYHNDTRKVYSMDMNCSTNMRIYKDEEEKWMLNTYMPVNISPISDANYKEPKWFIDHLYFILNNNKEYVDHVLKFIAHLLFRPEKRIESAIVISGVQGSGKSFIFKVLERLIGFHNCNQVNPDDLTAKFKDDWIGKRLLCIEEVKKNDKKDYGYYDKLKTLFTNDHITYDIKMKNKLRVQNCLHYIFFSNYANPIAFQKDDRRFFYVHSKLKREDLKPQSYWDDQFSYISEEKDTEELSSLMKYLKEEILPTVSEGFHKARPPQTSDLSQAIDTSGSQLVSWIEEQKEMKEKGSYFEKNTWFAISDFIKDMPPQLSNVKKSPEYISGVLKDCGLTGVPDGRHPRVTVDGTKYTPYMWDYSEKHLNLKWWSDKSNNKAAYRVKPKWDFETVNGGYGNE